MFENLQSYPPTISIEICASITECKRGLPDLFGNFLKNTWQRYERKTRQYTRKSFRKFLNNVNSKGYSPDFRSII